MIVTHTPTGWEVVFQAAHALLAGRLAVSWKLQVPIDFWVETLAAIIDHDDLKESFGKNTYLTELGAPKDFSQFKMTARERYAEAQRRLDSGKRKHRWIGLMASRHIEALYSQEIVSKRLTALMKEERGRRSAILHELRIPERQLEAAYELLHWCDRTSLILCQGALPAMHRRIEILTSGDGCRYEIWHNEDKSVSVEPWPFRDDVLEVGVEVRRAAQLGFSSDRQLEKVLLASPIEDRRWKFSRPPSNT